MTAPRCKPGDLCLVIRGNSKGRTVITVKIISMEEVVAVFHNLCPGTVRLGPDIQKPIWLIDTPIEWSVREWGIHKNLPYLPDSFLLPITPPSSMVDETQFHELPKETTK